jgi:MFS family permease
VLELFKTPGPLRRFLLVSLQSSIGNNVGYVALLVIAYQQLRSPWAITLLLLAEFLPSILFGSAFGWLADRASRRLLVVVTDVVRCIAFAGIAFSDQFVLTLLLALVAGTGQALFTPASRAVIPTLAPRDVDRAMGALVFCISVASLAGAALAAVVLLFTSTQTLLLLNAASFALSAVVLAGLPLDAQVRVPAVDHDGPPEPEVDHSIRAALRLIRSIDGVPLVITVAAGTTLAFAMINVAEPLLATGPLSAGPAGFALLVAAFGLGTTVGATQGRTRISTMIAAAAGSALTLTFTAVAPSIGVACLTFAASGYFGGMLVSSEQRLMATLVPPAYQGRAYGFKDSLDSTAFVLAYVIGGALAVVAGPRWIFGIAGATAGLLCLGVVLFRRAVARADPANA